MLFTTVAALLLPVATMAVPAQRPAVGDNKCSPVSYTLTEYVLTRSPSYAFVSFNVQSAYTADSTADDPVSAGVNCEADGSDLPTKDNECNFAGLPLDNLSFDLRESSDVPSYRINHQWRCNNATWTSANDIKLPPLDCDEIENGKNGDSVTCHANPIIFTPQNTRKLSEKDFTEDDSKKAAGKAKATGKSTGKAKATTTSTAHPTSCPSCH